MPFMPIKSTHVQGRCSHLLPSSPLRPLKKRLLWEAVARLLCGALNSPEPAPVPLPAIYGRETLMLVLCNSFTLLD